VELRKKFVLLALIYALSLTVNVALSAYCIMVYIEPAFQNYQAAAVDEERLGQVKRILEEQRDMLSEGRSPEDLDRTYADTQRRLDLVRVLIPDFDATFNQTLQQKDTAVQAWLKQRHQGPGPAKLPDEVAVSFDHLFRMLLKAVNDLDQERQAKVNEAAEMQERVVSILIGNTAAGAFVCLVGVYFVRRWVLKPVGGLREATKQLAQGHFDYRIQPRSRDELGQLASEVNQMASTIVHMQRQMLEQERLAAAGEMVTRLAHNIRNPLAGIRGLAETSIGLHPVDEDLVGAQQRIINTVDRFEKWLRDLQQSVSPLQLHPDDVVIGDLLNGVVTALTPMLERRGVKIEVLIDPVVRHVHIDSLHFEQAVVALVTNAVQASQAGQTVHIRVAPALEAPDRWRLTVEDEGVGIPSELRSKIFLPYFTTKPEGNGIGLSIASKVVRLHGGELTVESEVGRGSRFHAIMPGLVAEA